MYFLVEESHTIIGNHQKELIQYAILLRSNDKEKLLNELQKREELKCGNSQLIRLSENCYYYNRMEISSYTRTTRKYIIKDLNDVKEV